MDFIVSPSLYLVIQSLILPYSSKATKICCQTVVSWLCEMAASEVDCQLSIHEVLCQFSCRPGCVKHQSMAMSDGLSTKCTPWSLPILTTIIYNLYLSMRNKMTHCTTTKYSSTLLKTNLMFMHLYIQTP